MQNNLKNKVTNPNTNNIPEKIQETINKNISIVTKEDYFEVMQKYKDLDQETQIFK